MSTEAKAAVINAKDANEGIDNLGFALVKNREDVVYTLVLTILEHFNGRFTNQYQTVRYLLNGLRCKHLGEFRWYKDTYLSRVMELPGNDLEHWKAKFINGLPPLFAKRVKKNSKDFLRSYSLWQFYLWKINKSLHPRRQLKIDKLREISQLGDFCVQFGVHSSLNMTEGKVCKEAARFRVGP
ncbi:hypothetical protein H5410_050516 [Solanum commersonii]|uniref:Uncharacterized protein n=1 Tax=Solanum commersonii TaxID=4109 RepID=A0A9J5WVP0_SOLCO|nr:hypothetical protein H5410_050516 [Solanum commersonii]